LPALSKKLAKEPKSDAVAITKKGKPVLALMSWELYESIIETLEVLDDKELMVALRQGIKEAKAGKGISWEEAKKGLI
ncbi:MAG: type II toxin-antitoxin system Phd/YefM family antitoxin, partial [Chthoniobacteraceae bacterium]|nr:type II toxin-antitoxin system Phd/YefM family antitoxin [Chthoniobacteraceae bacterium]